MLLVCKSSKSSVISIKACLILLFLSEENIWKLVESLPVEQHDNFYAVFISNESKSVIKNETFNLSYFKNLALQ